MRRWLIITFSCSVYLSIQEKNSKLIMLYACPPHPTVMKPTVADESHDRVQRNIPYLGIA